MAAAPMTPLELFRVAVGQAYREAPLPTDGCNPPATLQIFVPHMSPAGLHALIRASRDLGAITLRYREVTDMGRPVGYATEVTGRATAVRELMAVWDGAIIDEMVRTAWSAADLAEARRFGEGVDLSRTHDPGEGLG